MLEQRRSFDPHHRKAARPEHYSATSRSAPPVRSAAARIRRMPSSSP
jgi:hypothetical protein